MSAQGPSSPAGEQAGLAPARRRRPSIRRLLVWVLLATQVPGLLAGIGLAYLEYDRQRAALTQRTDDGTVALARLVRQRIERIQAGLDRIARQVPGDERRLGDFVGHASALARELEVDAIVLVRPSGEQLVNTHFREGQPLAGIMPPAFLEVLTRGPGVLDAMMSPVAGRLVVAVGVPVLVGRQPTYALHAILDVDRLQPLVAAVPVPAGWVVAIVDGHDRIIARLPHPEQFIGKEINESLRQPMRRQNFGTFETVTLDGVPMVTSFRKPPNAAWTSVVAVPRAELLAPAWRSMALLAGLMGVLLAVSLAGALLVHRRIVASVERLRGAAAEMAVREPAPGPLWFREADELGAALVASSRALRESALELGRSEQMLAAILHTARSAIVVLDEQQCILLANAAAEAMFRSPRERLLGTSLEPLFTPESWREYLREAQLAAGNGSPGAVRNVFAQCLRSGGVRFPAEFAVASFVDRGGHRMYSVILRDVAERLQYQRNLRAAQRAVEQAGLRYERTLLREIDVRQAEIARELHDSVGSVVSGVSLLLEAARSRVRDPDLIGALLEKSQEQVRLVAQRVRQLARGIMPAGSDAGALAPALEQYAHDVTELRGLRCSMRARGRFDDVPPGDAGHVYRIVQEAITNAARHGEARHVAIRLARAGNDCSLSVRDDGKGCDLAFVHTSHPGLGLKSMQARARELGGQLELRNRRAGGCEAYLRWQAVRAGNDPLDEVPTGASQPRSPT